MALSPDDRRSLAAHLRNRAENQPNLTPEQRDEARRFAEIGESLAAWQGRKAMAEATADRNTVNTATQTPSAVEPTPMPGSLPAWPGVGQRLMRQAGKRLALSRRDTVHIVTNMPHGLTQICPRQRADDAAGRASIPPAPG